MVAIRSVHVRLIALLICNGADVNFRSYVYKYGDVLPFEAALLRDYRFDLGVFYVVEMLLVSGCSCGVFSLEEDHKFKTRYIDCEIKNLMMKWNVQENNVKPLMQQCRRVILKHLSPRASKMIEKLPLPQCVIKYLSIPELDDIVARYYGQRRNIFRIDEKLRLLADQDCFDRFARNGSSPKCYLIPMLVNFVCYILIILINC